MTAVAERAFSQGGKKKPLATLQRRQRFIVLADFVF
jgi:hypothetical protein